MQDRYVGDIGDFGKLGLLRAVAAAGTRLGVVWYLNPDEDANTDGGFTQYLTDAGHNLRGCDPCLHDALRGLVLKGDRRVAAIRESGILPTETLYFEDPLTFRNLPAVGESAREARAGRRRQWLEAALVATSEADVVFLDPDNGLAGRSAKPHTKRGQKFVFMDEIRQWTERGQSVILYHHCGRQRGGMLALAESLAVDLYRELRPDWVVGLSYHRQQARLYLVIGCGRSTPVLRDTVDRFLEGPWGAQGHFQRAAVVP